MVLILYGCSTKEVRLPQSQYVHQYHLVGLNALYCAFSNDRIVYDPTLLNRYQILDLHRLYAQYPNFFIQRVLLMILP